jgi:hypothetical protein
MSIVKPCASMISSVQPSRHDASNSTSMAKAMAESVKQNVWTHWGHRQLTKVNLLTSTGQLLDLSSNFGEPGWDRTSDLLIKSQLLYH